MGRRKGGPRDREGSLSTFWGEGKLRGEARRDTGLEEQPEIHCDGKGESICKIRRMRGQRSKV
jgi:hypothetical protein